MGIRRRDFLRLAVGTGAALGSSACSDVEDESVPSTDAGSDASFDAAVPNDTAQNDVSEPPEASELYGPWWVHLVGTTALLRFQTRGNRPAAVFYTDAQGTEQAAEVVSVTRDITWEFPPAVIEVEFRDEPGTYTQHEARIPASTSGVTAFRIVEAGRAETLGNLPVVPSAGAALRVAWISDTSAGVDVELAERVRQAAPQYLLHGGDIQYISNPVDTWAGHFERYRATLQSAWCNYIIGNHEFDTAAEFRSQYDRYFGAQWGPDAAPDYGEVRVGGLHFILLNSESDDSAADNPVDWTTGAQLAWFQDALNRASADPDVRHIIVAFHRPFFTFGSSRPDLDARAVLHPLIVAAGVSLVLTGHNHSYEHFTVDGVTYVVDGGGGAGLYDPDENIDWVQENSPGDLALRTVADRSHGITILDLSADGALSIRRETESGAETDAFVIPARG